ncbi:ABC transporter substrate-binding protein [Roseomonas sp. 18066]|uniref:ABC transporter substrate-binding protein n=1 Tax=Roseomonas sp. 18066 TaxID=2681412 RepID=UPI0013588867|nr:ABC transporter substrate-binding protein [Roseomonas sp. 18066]
MSLPTLSKVLAGVLLLGAPALAAETPVPGGHLTWGVTTEPVCFDPHRSSQQNAFIAICHYIDSLVGKRADGSYSPWLARSWTVSPDGREYSFALREDVRFHDGEVFDAAAVKANFDHVRDPRNTTNTARPLLSLDRVEVVSPYVVKFVLNRRDSGFLEATSSVKLGLISPKRLASGEGLCSGGARRAGTGPLSSRLIVCDEPVSALDIGVQARRGTALLLISHDLAVVNDLADRVLVFQAGKLVEQGAAETVFATPRHAYTRELPAALPRI